MPANFSHGKWQCHYMPEEYRITGKGCIITNNEKYIASVQNDDDGRLISVAPDMYELLCTLYHENAIPKTLGSNYPALEKMHSIVEAVTGDKIRFPDESIGVSP